MKQFSGSVITINVMGYSQPASPLVSWVAGCQGVELPGCYCSAGNGNLIAVRYQPDNPAQPSVEGKDGPLIMMMNLFNYIFMYEVASCYCFIRKHNDNNEYNASNFPK